MNLFPGATGFSHWAVSPLESVSSRLRASRSPTSDQNRPIRTSDPSSTRRRCRPCTRGGAWSVLTAGPGAPLWSPASHLSPQSRAPFRRSTDPRAQSRRTERGLPVGAPTGSPPLPVTSRWEKQVRATRPPDSAETRSARHPASSTSITQ